MRHASGHAFRGRRSNLHSRFQCLALLPKPPKVPFTRSCAACVDTAASFCTRHAYSPPWALCTRMMLSVLVKSSYCRMLIDAVVPSSLTASAGTAPGVMAASAPTLSVATMGTSSFSQTKNSGRSPVPTTHWMLVRSPTFRSRTNANGVIFGGTVFCACYAIVFFVWRAVKFVVLVQA